VGCLWNILADLAYLGDESVRLLESRSYEELIGPQD
jgi:hypothetical protein